MKMNLLIGAGLATLAAAAVAAPAMMDGGDMTRADLTAKVKEHFTQMDKNKDGIISKDEMPAMPEGAMAMGGNMPDMKMPDAKESFDRIDTNKDGMISRDEFAAGRQVRIERRVVMNGAPGGDMKMRHGGGHMGMMLKRADSNNDGNVTLAEAEAMAMKHFDQMDTNKDGKVTREERKAARPMMMQMHRVEKSS